MNHSVYLSKKVGKFRYGIYANVNEQTPSTWGSMLQILHCGQTTFMKKIRAHVGNADAEQIRNIKRNHVPVWTPSCVCGVSKSDIKIILPVLCVDIDCHPERNENPLLSDESYREDIKKKIWDNEKSLYAMSVSLSGRGLFLIYLLDPKLYREHFEGLFWGVARHIKETYGLDVDEQTRNINRLRACTTDLCPMVRADDYLVEGWSDMGTPPEKESAPVVSHTTRKVEVFGGAISEGVLADASFRSALRELVMSNCNVDVNEYNDWIKVGWHCANLDDEELFRSISQSDSKYDSNEFDRKWRNLCATKGGSESDAWVWLASEAKREWGREWVRIVNTRAEIKRMRALL